MRLHDGRPVGRGPIRPPRERTEWEKRARKALDFWDASGLEGSVASAIHEGFRDGIKRAAAAVQERGHPALAIDLTRLAETQAAASRP
jgi:hypothetical protein